MITTNWYFTINQDVDEQWRANEGPVGMATNCTESGDNTGHLCVVAQHDLTFPRKPRLEEQFLWLTASLLTINMNNVRTARTSIKHHGRWVIAMHINDTWEQHRSITKDMVYTKKKNYTLCFKRISQQNIPIVHEDEIWITQNNSQSALNVRVAHRFGSFETTKILNNWVIEPLDDIELTQKHEGKKDNFAICTSSCCNFDLFMRLSRTSYILHCVYCEVHFHFNSFANQVLLSEYARVSSFFNIHHLWQ